MGTSGIRLLRRLGRFGLGIVGLYLLAQVIGRTIRRIRPGLTPLWAVPRLTMPSRWRFFGPPEQILDRAGITPGMQVLEVGPGPGSVTVPLAQRVSARGGGSVTCVEIQPEMIALLRERLQNAEVPNVEVIQGDGRQLPLPENRFDVVLLVDVVGETPDAPALFRECTRVLKPGGVLAVTEQLMDPDFRLPGTLRKLAIKAHLLDAGSIGWPWWTYTARFHKENNIVRRCSMAVRETKAPIRSDFAGRAMTRAQRAFTNLHVLLYRLSGGAIAGRMGKSPVLLLTTRGRKTGKLRTTPLLYLADGDHFVIVASNGGSTRHPTWWLNLQSNKDATVQVKRQKIRVRAELAGAQERQDLWARLVAMYPDYAEYQKRTQREIPVVVLQSVGIP